MAIMTVLLGGLASAMMIASRAVPDRNTTLGATLDSAYAADQLAAELFTAKSFTVRTSTAVEFTVADRNNDGADETIRYQWSGVPGASLTRKYNAGLAVTVAGDVNEFALLYDVVAVQSTTQPGPNESAETLLISFDSATGSLSDSNIDSNNWVGQCFMPALQADATAWKITRVKIQASTHGNNKGVNWIQLRLPTGSLLLPASTVLEQVQMLESSLTATPWWQQFSFSTASGLSPSQGMCLVVAFASTTGDADTANIRKSGGGALSNSNFVKTSNAGSSWSATTESLLYYVYGTITAPTAPVVTQQYYVTRVRIKLRTGSNADARAETFVQILNEPEVTGP